MAIGEPIDRTFMLWYIEIVIGHIDDYAHSSEVGVLPTHTPTPNYTHKDPTRVSRFWRGVIEDKH